MVFFFLSPFCHKQRETEKLSSEAIVLKTEAIPWGLPTIASVSRLSLDFRLKLRWAPQFLANHYLRLFVQIAHVTPGHSSCLYQRSAAGLHWGNKCGNAEEGEGRSWHMLHQSPVTATRFGLRVPGRDTCGHAETGENISIKMATITTRLRRIIGNVGEF